MHKVLIRPLVPDDALISWAWRNDPEVWRYTGSKPNIYITPEIEHEWIIKAIAEENSARFAITVDDYYIGNIQLTDISNSDSAEYHIFIGDKSYWGKGIAHLATMQIIRYANEVLKLKKIFLKVNIEHLKAISLYKNCGFNKTITEGEYLHMTLDLANTPKPLLSVFLMTYNHEKYIAQALDWIIMQKTDFDFEIVVGEDCSTDLTRNIILEYQKHWPGKFKLLLHEKNIGAIENQNAIFAICKGKYIAMCEGDDYWTDPLKLQKQVDFLEMNSDFSMCCHNSVQVFDGETIEKNYLAKFREGEFHCNDIWSDWMFATASFLFRLEIIKKELFIKFAKHRHMLQGDLFLLITALEYGKIYSMADIMCVYRKHSGSITSDGSSPPTWRMGKMLKYINLISKVYDGKYKIISKEYYTFKAFRYAYVCKERKLYMKAVCFLLRAFLKQPSKFLELLKNEIKLKKNIIK